MKSTPCRARLVERSLRVVETVQRRQRSGDVAVRRNETRIQAHRFAERLHRALVLSERARREPQAVERKRFARVRLRPRRAQLERFVPGLRRVHVVAPRNEIALALADAIAQLERSLRDRRGLRRSSCVAIDGSEQRMSHREVRVDLDRALQVRNGIQPRENAAVVEGERVGVERFERRGGRVRERGVEILNRFERFSQFFAQPRCGASERGEHLLGAGGFNLFARHHVAALGIDGFEREHVVAAEFADRPRHQRLQLLAARDVAGELTRHALIRRSLHQPQRLPHAVVWEHLEERGLFQGNRKRNLQRAVEYRLVRVVDEVGEDDRVAVRERRRPRQEARGEHGGHSNDRRKRCRRDPWTEPPRRVPFRNGRRVERGRYRGRRLRTCSRIHLQRMHHDPFES